MMALQVHFIENGRDMHQRNARATHFRKQQQDKAREQDQKRKAEAAEELDSDLVAAAMTTIPATQNEVAAFTVRLDASEAQHDVYNDATVTALIQSQAELEVINRQLEQVRHELDEMLQRAYVMEDGRRVFLNQDGTEAIDEFGNTVSLELVPVENVPNGARISDQFKAHLALNHQLSNTAEDKQAEIDEIHRFDDLLHDANERHDAVRAKIEEGDLTKGELDALSDELDQMDIELLQAMPPAVRAHVPDFGLSGNTPDMSAPFNQTATHASSPEVARAEASGLEFGTR